MVRGVQLQVPLQKLCETGWTEKYRAIRKFDTMFGNIAQSLENLSLEGNRDTKQKAYLEKIIERRGVTLIVCAHFLNTGMVLTIVDLVIVGLVWRGFP